MKKLNFKLSVVLIYAFANANAQTATTLAGTNGSWGSTDGIGTSASFHSPWGVATDGSGNLYVADCDNNEIRKIDIATATVSTFSTGGFFKPSGVTIDGGNLYVADRYNHEIKKIVIATGAITTLAGTTTPGSADGTGVAASFNNPIGIVADGLGDLYIGDTGNNEIRKIVISTGVVSTLAGTTTPGSADGTGAVASFYNPAGLVLDGLGNLYVCDYVNNEIRKIVISTGAVTTTAVGFNGPTGVVADGSGNLFVTERGGSGGKVDRVIISSGAVTIIPGATLAGTVDGAKAIAMDVSGNLFISQDQIIREITSPLGIDQNSFPDNQFVIFPNPSTDNLTIELPENISKTSLQIFNTIGELIYSLTTTNQKTDIDVSSFASGIYVIQIADSKNISRKKFIKQ